VASWSPSSTSERDDALSQHERTVIDITPSASRLSGSLRDIGYDFPAALADIVDNSISASASRIDVEIKFDGADSYVLVADDGSGMSEPELNEALRFGSRRRYRGGDLGRYGLGLKTASLSQCRRVTVASRRAPLQRRITTRCLDLDRILRTDRWQITEPLDGWAAGRSAEWLDAGPGTVVIWERLDRILPEQRPEGGWARRRLEGLARRSAEYLGMVFHRFIEGADAAGEPVVITVNGEKVRSWNPFAPEEAETRELPLQMFEVETGALTGSVALRRWLLPPRDRFSSVEEWERLSGPNKWNRQQGLYIYRADRLIQGGGWCGIRAIDEHTKLARASLDFQTDLDDLFHINVAKMRVILPAQVRSPLEAPVHELCHRADGVYRRESPRNRRDEAGASSNGRDAGAGTDAGTLGSDIVAAALDAGELDGFRRVMERLRQIAPQSADLLGW